MNTAPPSTAKESGTTWSRVLATVCATLLGGAVMGLVADRIAHSEWKGNVDAALAQKASTAKEVTTALVVLANHGSELQSLRNQVAALRGELAATRTELLDAVQRGRQADFTARDWMREKARIDAQFERLFTILLPGPEDDDR